MRGLVFPVATRRLAARAIVLTAPLALAACERETTPPLIQVLGLSPREVEEGDRVVIDGVGFPEGKVAHVAFRGDLHRPGVAPVRDVEVDVDAAVTSGTELELPVTASFEQLFAGPGDHVAHTTFSGDVTVAFRARSTAAPPVAGTLHDVWLDVRPPASRRARSIEDDDEGERTMAFLGIKLNPAVVPAGGVLIEAIEPGSRADSGRLLAGDVITEMNGVRVLTTHDLVAAPGDRTAWLRIRRAGSPHEDVATVSLLGFQPPAAATLLPSVVILSFAALLLVLFFAPTPALVVWLERSISAHLLARRRREGERAAPRPRSRRPPYALAVGATFVFALLPLGRPLGLGDVDAGILFVASSTALATLALFTAGSRPGRPYSVVAASGAAVRVLGLAVPVAAAVIAAVMMTGSLHVEDLVRSQAGWPWGWTVFKSPFALALFGLSAVSLLAGGHVDARPLPEAAAAPSSAAPFAGPPHSDARRRVLFLATWVYRVVVSVLGAALFLGGWRIPGVAPEQVEGHFGWTALGAALFVVKVWWVVAALAAAELALPRIGPERAMPLLGRWLAPLSVFAVLSTALWVARGPEASAETLVGAVLVALTFAAMLHVATRVRRFQRERGGQLDPFL